MPDSLHNPGYALQVLRGTEVPLDALRGKQVAVLGYGNQGRSHALNLRDSGISVRVGGRDGSAGTVQANAEGFETGGIAHVSRGADLIIVALPDEVHAHVWRSELASVVASGQT
ncbi:MAG: NAD(P)-binding domain-containing protein, partial [Phycisphaerae bacterium]|nr:NAD(P)-binding domain-containing protein [Phycisphaerae bacterium]